MRPPAGPGRTAYAAASPECISASRSEALARDRTPVALRVLCLRKGRGRPFDRTAPVTREGFGCCDDDGESRRRKQCYQCSHKAIPFMLRFVYTGSAALTQELVLFRANDPASKVRALGRFVKFNMLHKARQAVM